MNKLHEYIHAQWEAKKQEIEKNRLIIAEAKNKYSEEIKALWDKNLVLNGEVCAYIDIIANWNKLEETK